MKWYDDIREELTITAILIIALVCALAAWKAGAKEAWVVIGSCAGVLGGYLKGRAVKGGNGPTPSPPAPGPGEPPG